MKKTILSIAVAAIVSTSTFAQEQKPTATPATPTATTPAAKNANTAEKRAERYLFKLNEEYVLTEEQKPKVKTIILTREIQRDELRKQNPDNNDAFVSAFKKVNAETDKEIKDLLTPAQIEHQKKYREEIRERNKANAAKKGNGTTPPPTAPKVPEGTPPPPPPAPEKK